MEYICGNCRYYTKKDSDEHCWITGKAITFNQPICTFNFKPKKEDEEE